MDYRRGFSQRVSLPEPEFHVFRKDKSQPHSIFAPANGFCLELDFMVRSVPRGFVTCEPDGIDLARRPALICLYKDSGRADVFHIVQPWGFAGPMESSEAVDVPAFGPRQVFIRERLFEPLYE